MTISMWLAPLALLLAVAAAWAIARLFARYGPQRESGLPLAVFRIAIVAVLLIEVGQLAVCAPLVFDAMPFADPGEPGFAGGFYLWFAALAALAVGWHTRLAAVVNYVLSVVTFGGFTTFEYHHDYVVTGLALLLCVAPVSARWSVDARRDETPRDVSAVWSKLLLFVGLGVVYFDSLFYKLDSAMWLGGRGLWTPASSPHFAWSDFTPLLDVQVLALGLGWLTLAFEIAFPVLMWFDRARWPLLAVGVGLHLGIAAVFPIPGFGLGAVALYVLLVPPAVWSRLDRKLRAPAPAPREVRPACAALLAGAVAFAQVAAIWQSDLVKKQCALVGLGYQHGKVAKLATRFTERTRPLLGVTRHGVFMDHHFRAHDRIVTLARVDADGERHFLPMFTRTGQPGLGVLWGRVWVWWNFRVAGPWVDDAALARGAERMTAFWCGRNRVPLDGARFVLLAKDVEPALEWRAGHLRTQLEGGWYELGDVEWRDGGCEVRIVGGAAPR